MKQKEWLEMWHGDLVKEESTGSTFVTVQFTGKGVFAREVLCDPDAGPDDVYELGDMYFLTKDALMREDMHLLNGEE